MMNTLKYYLTIAVLAAGLSTLKAQFTNSGLLVVDGGAIYVIGNFENTASGEIRNAGTFEIKGNYVNAGNVEGGDQNGTTYEGTFVLNGTSAQTFDNGGDTIYNLTLNNSLGVTGSNVVVANTLTLTSGKWSVGADDFEFGPNATSVSGSSLDNYMITDGAGVISKNYSASSSFQFPVGTASGYFPLTLEPDAANSLSIANVDDVYDTPEPTPTGLRTSDAVDATWMITVSSAGSVDITTQHPGTSHLTGFNQLNSSHMLWEEGVSTVWGNTTSSVSGSDPYLTTSVGNSLNSGTYFLGVDDAEFTNLEIGAFLEGPYDKVTTNVMSTNLTSSGVLLANATSQPFNTVPWSYGGGETIDATFITNHPEIVDWVLVELRNATTPATVEYRAACLITADGTLLDVNGDEGVFMNAPAGSYHVAIHHRNHTSVATNSPITFSSNSDTPGSWDIRSSTTNVLGGVASLKAVGSYFVVYTGDPDGNNDINASDEAIWLAQNGSTPVYASGDYDLNGDVNASDEAIWLQNNGKVISFP